MDVGSGWRGSGPSGRRWNAPSSTSGNWRSEQGDQGAGPYRGGPPPPRGDGSGGGGAYVNGNSRWRDEEGPYRGGSRGRATTAFGRQRSRNDGHDLPEWAMDDDDDRAGGAGGTFDASGKFRAPSSESPPPTASSKAGSAPPQESREANGKSDRNAVSTLVNFRSFLQATDIFFVRPVLRKYARDQKCKREEKKIPFIPTRRLWLLA